MAIEYTRADTSALTLDDLPEVMDVKVAAAAVHMESHALRRAIRAGRLPAFLPGGERDPRKPGRGMGYRIKRSDLQAWYFGQNARQSR